MRNTLFGFLILLTALGCTANRLPILKQEDVSSDAATPKAIQVQYLGSSGFVIRRGSDVILAAPFFTNPSLCRIIFGRIKADKKKVDEVLGPLELKKVKAILVGHAHLDHLMDVPCAAGHCAKAVTIYGSKSMINILSAEDANLPKEAKLGEVEAGKWVRIEGTQIRFMAIESEHSPHILGIKFSSGKVKTKLSRLPRRACNWKEGQTYAYVIDFLGDDGETVDFRIHFQDAASGPSLGSSPQFNAPADRKQVDLCIMCVAAFEQVKHYPETIIRELKPRYVILGHWENFFASWTDDPKRLRHVPFTDPRRFIKRLEKVLPKGSKWYLPAPKVTMGFP